MTDVILGGLIMETGVILKTQNGEEVAIGVEMELPVAINTKVEPIIVIPVAKKQNQYSKVLEQIANNFQFLEALIFYFFTNFKYI